MAVEFPHSFCAYGPLVLENVNGSRSFPFLSVPMDHLFWKMLMAVGVFHILSVPMDHLF